MKKNEKLSTDLKVDKKGYSYVEAQLCGHCGNVQPVEDINHMNKKTFMALSICSKCGSPIVTALGDRKLIEDFMSQVQMDINQKFM